MARFCTFASSSKGNCSYLSGGKTAVLVDVGISLKQLRIQMSSRGVEPNQLSGVVITHEHTDHVRGLGVLLGAYNLPVYGSAETLEFLVARGMVPSHADLRPVEGTFALGELEVTAFDTPHDAVHSYGYRFELPDETAIGVATDLGSITPTVQKALEGCGLVLLESNFDPGMLSVGRYPYIVKRRIQGEFGHLANEDCAQGIAQLITKGTTRFVLGHLSQNNNLPQLAYETTKCQLTGERMVEGRDYLLSVAPATEAHAMVVF